MITIPLPQLPPATTRHEICGSMRTISNVQFPVKVMNSKISVFCYSLAKGDSG